MRTTSVSAEDAWSSSPRTVNETAFDRLQELILSGEIEVGARLDERRLAERIGVSRTPLRDAISQLVALGVVEHRAYKGNFVRAITARGVTELYEVRKALEGLATRAAAENAAPEDLVRLEAVIDEGTAAFNRHDLIAFERSDRAFHSLIAELSANQLLIEELERLTVRVQLVRRIANLETTVAVDTIGDRRDVLRAMRAGDARAAESAMTRHIGVVQEQTIRRLTSR